jgi:DNA polymerase-3 subunit delta
MNTSRLDARTASENDLATAVGSMPFLAAQRLVLLEHASKKFTGLEGHKRFTAFLDSVPPSTLLVVLEIDDLKEKDIPAHWLVKWAGKAGEKAKAESSFLPRPKEMPGWIVSEAKRQGGSIEPAAAARLAEMTGENTRQAAQEITKLLTYVNFAHAIGLEDVEAVSIVTAEASIFDFVDALSERNGRRAQKLLAQMLESQDAFEIFPMVIRQFRLLILARDVMDDGGQLNEAAQAIGGHPFVAEKAWGQARKFQMETLESIYRRLLSMDEAAKTGGMPLDAALEMFVVELTK